MCLGTYVFALLTHLLNKICQFVLFYEIFGFFSRVCRKRILKREMPVMLLPVRPPRAFVAKLLRKSPYDSQILSRSALPLRQ